MLLLLSFSTVVQCVKMQFILEIIIVKTFMVIFSVKNKTVANLNLVKIELIKFRINVLKVLYVSLGWLCKLILCYAVKMKWKMFL